MPPRAPPAVCAWPDCGREYATKRDLQRHQLSHGAPQFACNTPGCDRKFYRRDALLRHQRNKTCARRLARRDQGHDEDDTEDVNASPVEFVAESTQARRPQRTDSLESSSSSSRGFPIVYRQAMPHTRVDSVDEGLDFDEDDDEDEFEAHLGGTAASPIRSNPFGSRRYTGPYDMPSHGSAPRSPTRSPTASMRNSFGYGPSSYGPPPLSASYYDASAPLYVSTSLNEHRFYGKTSNARGSVGGDPDDDF